MNCTALTSLWHWRAAHIGLLALALIALVPPASAEERPAPRPQATPATRFALPIGLPGKPPGDGFFIRHGYTAENTWYNPGYWHTGEDWYALEGDTARAAVYAVADGTVVYAGANYPGRVVIVRHPPDLYSMYGHLDPALRVRVGQRVARGDQLGAVLRRGDKVPNHLHFELRTFLTTGPVNGDRPRYAFRCGPRCPPGPGYWPMRAPDLPSDLGWRNPLHVIAGRSLAAIPAGAEVVVATRPFSPSLTLWSSVPGGATPARALASLNVGGGERLALLEAQAGAEDARSPGASGYALWYRVRAPDGRSGWAQAAVPNAFETGSDGRASTVSFNLLAP
jgi:murein DD-endopeptidase MepM/ murein hydrolase activator NlpD